jgi:hypothetical protein
LAKTPRSSRRRMSSRLSHPHATTTPKRTR